MSQAAPDPFRLRALAEPESPSPPPKATEWDRPDTRRWDRWLRDLHKRVALDSISLQVAGVLVRHADNVTGECWPKLATICKATGLSRSSVQRGIRRLEATGLVRVERGGPDHGSSHYWLLDADDDVRQEAARAAERAAQSRAALLQRQKAAAEHRRAEADRPWRRRRRKRRAKVVAPGQLNLDHAALNLAGDATPGGV